MGWGKCFKVNDERARDPPVLFTLKNQANIIAWFDSNGQIKVMATGLSGIK